MVTDYQIIDPDGTVVYDPKQIEPQLLQFDANHRRLRTIARVEKAPLLRAAYHVGSRLRRLTTGDEFSLDPFPVIEDQQVQVGYVRDFLSRALVPAKARVMKTKVDLVDVIRDAKHQRSLLRDTTPQHTDAQKTYGATKQAFITSRGEEKYDAALAYLDAIGTESDSRAAITNASIRRTGLDDHIDALLQMYDISHGVINCTEMLIAHTDVYLRGMQTLLPLQKQTIAMSAVAQAIGQQMSSLHDSYTTVNNMFAMSCDHLRDLNLSYSNFRSIPGAHSLHMIAHGLHASLQPRGSTD